MRATVCLWSSLGKGVISLYDLELEANGEIAIPASYDNLFNDRDFIRLAKEEGVRMAAVVWTEEGVEFPIEIRDGKVISWGIRTGLGEDKRWGLKEFFRNELKDVFHTASYYGLKEVSDFYEEAAQKTLSGEDRTGTWCLSEEKGGTCYVLCEHAPLWRNYIKKMIDIQVKSGAEIIQFDEMGRTFGCFCTHCMKAFSQFLRKRYPGRDWKREGIEQIRKFNYREYLQSKGLIFEENQYNLPLYREYCNYILFSSLKSQQKLAEYARAKGREKGVQIAITGNGLTQHRLIHLNLLYDFISCEHVPSFIPKGDNVHVYKLGLAFGKQTTVVWGIEACAKLRDLMKTHSINNLMRIWIAEGNFAGGCFMVPYGCYTLTGRGGFYPPMQPVKEYQNFIANNMHLWDGAESGATVALIYSFPSQNFENVSLYQKIAQRLLNLRIPYDFLLFWDGLMIDDSVCSEDFTKYQIVIIPYAPILTIKQREVLKKIVQEGKKLLVLGKAGIMNLDFTETKELKDELGGLANFRQVEKIEEIDKVFKEHISEMAIEILNAPESLKLNYFTNGRRLIIHLLNFTYDCESDRVTPVQEIRVRVKESGFKAATFYTPESPRERLTIRKDKAGVLIEIPLLKIYGVVELTGIFRIHKSLSNSLLEQGEQEFCYT